MMARDAESKHLAEGFAVLVDCHLGTCGCMIAAGAARQSFLKLARVFTQVVKKAGCPPKVATSRAFKERRRTFTRTFKVVGKEVPILLVR